MSAELSPRRSDAERFAAYGDCALGQLIVDNLTGRAQAGRLYACDYAGGNCGKSIIHTGERVGLLDEIMTGAVPGDLTGCSRLIEIAATIERG